MKKILIIGAGFLQDFVIKKAKSMGFYTLAVDGNPDAIGFQHADKIKVIDIVDEEACYEFAKSEQVDGVLTAATDYGVLTAAYIAKRMGIPGLEYKTAALIKNKYLVRKRLCEKHVDDTTQPYEVDANTDIARLIEQLTYPVIVKPCDGSGSRGISKVDEDEKLRTACNYAMSESRTHRATIEPFIEGEEYGAESLVINGEIHVLAIMKKWMTTPPYYAELGHAVPSGLPEKIEEKAVQCVKAAIEALGINHGAVNMDMLITKSGFIHIIDIGARMGGNMIGPYIIPYGTGIDYMENVLKISVGEEVQWTRIEHKAVATKLLAFPEGKIVSLPDFDALEKRYNVEIFHHLKIGDKVNEYHTNLDGCGYIIARADTVEEAEQKASKVLNVIEKSIFG